MATFTIPATADILLKTARTGKFRMPLKNLIAEPNGDYSVVLENRDAEVKFVFPSRERASAAWERVILDG